MSTLDVSDGTDDFSRLQAFLDKADLSDHFNNIYFHLCVRRVEDLKDISESDATSINMTKPQFSRLKRFLKDEKSNWMKIFRPWREKRPVTNVVPTTSPTPHHGPKYLISKECLKFCKSIGTGEYGEVFRGDWRDEHMSSVRVAIKTLNKHAAPRNEADIRKEADAMHSLNHPNILKLYGVVLSVDEPMMLVLELAALGSLESVLLSEGARFPIMKLYEYAEQIASGMEYLSEKQIVHRDLSTRNLLLVTKDRLKISDFGLARPLPNGKSYYEMTDPKHSKIPFGWTAPEALKTTRFTVHSDVWSFGVTLWEMFAHGAAPWGELNAVQILELVDAPLLKRLNRPEHCPPDAYHLMWTCWAHNPSDRPTFNGLRRLIRTILPHKATVIEPLLVENDPSVLTLKEGEVITITEFCEPNWCYGQSSTGVYGKFPKSHIQLDAKKNVADHETLPSPGDRLPVLSTDDISNPCNATHNFHISTTQLAGMTELQLQEMLGSKTITRNITPVASLVSESRRSSVFSTTSDTRSVSSVGHSVSPPGILSKTPQQNRPLPTLPYHRNISESNTDMHRPLVTRITRSQTVDVFPQPGPSIPRPTIRKPTNQNHMLQPSRQSHHGELPPPYTPSHTAIPPFCGNVAWTATPNPNRPHTVAFNSSSSEYAHLWEARSAHSPKATMDDSVLTSASTRRSLISFTDPSIPFDMPNPPHPYQNHTPQSLKPGGYASLQPSTATQRNKPPPLQAVDEDREEYMVMNSPHSRSPSPCVSDGQSKGETNSLTRSLSDPQMNVHGDEYVDMNEQNRLMLRNAAKRNLIRKPDCVNPQSQGKPTPSSRTTKTSPPKPIPRPRDWQSRPSHPTMSPVERMRSSTVPPPLHNNPPPSVLSPERKPPSGPVIKIQRVRLAVPDTSEKDAEDILKLYEWDVDTTIRHLKVAQGAELTNYNKEHVRQVTTAHRDTTEAVRYLKVEKVLQFAKSAGLKQATTSSCQSALDHCQWNCDRAIHFLLGQNK
ncbi:non-receptor tyrosine-protein kinase TNK1-like isoform X2 [Corticium candelabrum]|uniref:non-receptor tyrosine-protein kinase TNK1-like isoform X2 n=1 Tax=Corticium candelabrum TaxID=121492 RepID=UPI002E2552B7|nr:non-receptor tyrosine-protein kinase TNK1-like isoform X2 [Corticium candelabrum]